MGANSVLALYSTTAAVVIALYHEHALFRFNHYVCLLGSHVPHTKFIARPKSISRREPRRRKLSHVQKYTFTPSRQHRCLKPFIVTSSNPFAPHSTRTDLLCAFSRNLLEGEVVELCSEQDGSSKRERAGDKEGYNIIL